MSIEKPKENNFSQEKVDEEFKEILNNNPGVIEGLEKILREGDLGYEEKLRILEKWRQEQEERVESGSITDRETIEAIRDAYERAKAELERKNEEKEPNEF